MENKTEQQELRERLINYVTEVGVKYSFISEKVGVHRATLCHFVKGERNLTKQVYNNLIDFLDNVN